MFQPKNFKVWLLAGLASTAVTLSGCGATLQQADAQGEALGLFGGGYHTLDASGAPESMLPGRPFKRLASRLGLSADQQAQLKAIGRKYRGDLKPADFASKRAALKALLLADQVDGAALETFISARAQEVEAKKPVRLAMATELRAVLTPAQRDQLVAILRNEVPQREGRFAAFRDKMHQRLLGDLGLTAAQQQTIDTLKAKVESLKADGQRDRVREAIATFVASGDTQGLAAATAGARAKLPVAEIVAVATSLDRAQRTKIAAKMERMLAFHQAHNPLDH